MLQRQLRIKKTPAVEERIRRHIDNAHHQGTVEGKASLWKVEFHRCSYEFDAARFHVLLGSRYSPVSSMTRVIRTYLIEISGQRSEERRVGKECRSRG